ncbi:hypothetical protein [Maribacter aestuarii]|uniref:hypothetical protein n=1 Tax=Maribacter aestuarii TaxID=1130723 RepID=UPI00248C08AB|nr:hypothetical protein [Maribacter aestuarii]
MEKDNLEKLFAELRGSFDTEEPNTGHQQRFLEKLKSSNGVVQINRKKFIWWKPLSIAASIALLLGVVFGQLFSEPTIEERLAQISPEVSNAQFYFASLIEEQVKELEAESSPQTQKIISDTMAQLADLKLDYNKLEQELLKGGNSKLILSAMITNFQTRIDLLNDVLSQIETIKNLKNHNDEMSQEII